MEPIAFLTILASALFAARVMKVFTARLAEDDVLREGADSVRRPGLKGGLERLGNSKIASMPLDRAFGRRIEQSIARAGIDMTVGTYWALCVVCSFAGTVVGLVLSTMALPANVVLKVLVAVSCALLGASAPGFYVSSRIGQRRELIEATMSYTLDLLSIVVNSGQTIEQGIRTVAEKSDGPLAEEFAIADKQISVLGVPPAVALRDMAERVDVPALSLFCASVSQALASGSPLAGELRIQAEEAADRYYQMIDERAGKIANKMVFPLALMMLPAIMIIALVPVVLRLADQMPGVLPALT